MASDSVALMMSGGWDSRTLLAGASAVGVEPRCYSHGDLRSRELALVERICRETGRPCHLEPIDAEVLDPEVLRSSFSRTENVVFPHWHRAGTVLKARGADCVAAGVLGEVLGGHYGPATVARGLGKVLSVGRMLITSTYHPDPNIAPVDYLRFRNVGAQWYLKSEYQTAIDSPTERMTEDVERALGRLRARGVEGTMAQIEAFITEHRGVQYINQQLLSCRAFMDVALPFAGGELYQLSTEIPLPVKVHNTLNRRMLAQHAPQLLAFPMAATLLPASSPMLLQEVSRAVRKLWEEGGLHLHARTRGLLPRVRLGWVNFDFLRRGPGVQHVIEDLRADAWDREEIQRRVDLCLRSADPTILHPLYDQLGKIYTVDLMLR